MPITDESKGPKTKGVSMSYLIGFAFVVVIIIILGFCGQLVEKYKNWLFKQYCVLEQKRILRQDEVLKDGKNKD